MFLVLGLVSNENFLKDNNSISELKIKGGWGKTGNASGIPFYSSYNLERLNQGWRYGLLINSMGNRYRLGSYNRYQLWC